MRIGSNLGVTRTGGGPSAPAAVDNSVAFDAVSVPSAQFPTSTTWTHTPVGTARGVIVLIAQNIDTNDQVTDVTYGGVALSEMALSPFVHNSGSENGALYGYFLGASIPTGAQTVAVTIAGTPTQNKYAVCVSVTATADLTVDTTNTFQSASTTAPEVTLATSASTTTFVAAVLKSGSSSVAGFAPIAGFTDLAEHDFGVSGAGFARKTTNPTGGNVTVGWAHGVGEASAIFACAIK